MCGGKKPREGGPSGPPRALASGGDPTPGLTPGFAGAVQWVTVPGYHPPGKRRIVGDCPGVHPTREPCCSWLIIVTHIVYLKLGWIHHVYPVYLKLGGWLHMTCVSSVSGNGSDTQCIWCISVSQTPTCVCISHLSRSVLRVVPRTTRYLFFPTPSLLEGKLRPKKVGGQKSQW